MNEGITRITYQSNYAYQSLRGHVAYKLGKHGRFSYKTRIQSAILLGIQKLIRKKAYEAQHSVYVSQPSRHSSTSILG